MMSQTVLSLQALIWLIVNVAVDARKSDECLVRNLSATGDDFMSLYIDGREMTDLRYAGDWRYVDSVELPCTTRVIAIEVNDTLGGFGALLAYTDDGYVRTNSSWKCSNTRMKGWQEVDFNDSSWKNAVVVLGHDSLESLPNTTQGIIREDAQWIWTARYLDGDRNVFCRRNLGVNECRFGQPINECDHSMGRCIGLTTGYSCSCYPGYQNDGQQKCKDVDECLLESPGNKCNASSGACINTPGSYSCRCYEGFTNAGDQRCEGSSNNATLLILILGVSLGVSLLIVVALICAVSILRSRSSTSKDQGGYVANTSANRSDVGPMVGNVATNEPSPSDKTYAHLNLTAMLSNQNDNYEQIIE